MKIIVLLFSYILIVNNNVLADSTSDTEHLFNWAEVTFPSIFSITANTKEIELAESSGELAGIVRYRGYPGDIYVGIVNDTRVYVLGGMWPKLTYIDTLANLIELLSNNTKQQGFKANAGLDQYLLDRDKDGFETVVLDARASSIETEKQVSYRWLEGSTVLSQKAIMKTTLAQGEHTLTLEITGEEDNITTDSVDIYIKKNAGHLQRLNLPLQPQPTTARFKKLLDKEWPTTNGETSICLWEDDKFAAVSLTIDDNIAVDHDWWLKIGKEYDWTFTWFITINYLYENSNNSYFGSWNEFQKLADLGHDVQSHTMTHSANDDTRENDEMLIEYLDAFNHINEKLTDNRALTVSWPWGRFNREIGALFTIAGRGTSGSPNRAESIDYLNVNSIDTSVGKDYLDSILLGTSANSDLDRNRFIRGWLVSFYHLVKNKALAASEFSHLYQRSEDIWLGLFKDVALYGQERDTATLSVMTNNSNKIEFRLSDEMDDLLFNYPLTIKIKLYPGWQGIKATQAGKQLETNIIDHNDEAYALIKAIPDQGNIVIKPL